MQVALLGAALLVLLVISAASIFFVSAARRDSSLVVHTIEVEGQISAVLLDVSRAESAVRAYLLAPESSLLGQYQTAITALSSSVNKLLQLTSDNPVQTANGEQLKRAIDARLAEFQKTVDLAQRNDIAAANNTLRSLEAGNPVQRILDISATMHRAEDRLFAERTVSADRSQQLASVVTIAGSGLVIALAGLSIFLVRQSMQARDAAEVRLRDANLNLEATIDERTADLREANEEIQRFAYIVSHDLRSPLVNIMGFTSELEELRNAIFRRISALSKPLPASEETAENAKDSSPPALEEQDAKLSEEFDEALGFIKSSIAKMDRLISAILHLTREGRREFQPEKISVRELIDGIAGTVAHQAAEADAEIRVEPLPDIVSDRLALEQIFSNLIDNALKYLRTGVPGEITIKGRTKLGFAIYEIADNGRGIDSKDHQRIFELFRRAGAQDRPGQGIGLAHVRALVRRLGGTMSVTSEPNVGSTFTVTLPSKWTLSNQGKSA